MVQDALYFGTAAPQGPVSREQFESFMRDTVTPRFPQGLTTWNASGQWRGADGDTVHEPSHVLLLVHADDAASDQAVAEIIRTYKSRFHQEAVLRVRTAGCASL